MGYDPPHFSVCRSTANSKRRSGCNGGDFSNTCLYQFGLAKASSQKCHTYLVYGMACMRPSLKIDCQCAETSLCVVCRRTASSKRRSRANSDDFFEHVSCTCAWCLLHSCCSSEGVISRHKEWYGTPQEKLIASRRGPTL